ncbi:MAG: NADH-quinone oxidoreductase subunit M [Candidatus Nezhaarchaeota archaeon]|nr:NADH-quinone oxidoreductase subunit M [Candidatus Nezhaarchaeota archaeon]
MSLIDSSHLLIQAILVPIATSPIIYAAGRAMGKHTGWLVFLIMIYVTGLLLHVTLSLPGIPEGSLTASYPWAPYVGDFTLVADGLSAPIALTIALLCALIAIYSIGYMEHEHNLDAYYALYLLYAGGMIGTVLVTNLAAFFLFFELMLIPSWALIGVWGTGPKERIAFKYFMFTEAGALSLLGGIVASYFLSGTFDVMKMAPYLAKYDVPLLTAVVLAMLLGLMVKMAILPLHTWLPDAHAEAPTPISALLSPAMIGIGGYALIRIVYTAFPKVMSNWAFVIGLAVLAVATMIYGGAMALAQEDIKRLLAYSSISQMGYLLFGIASLSVLSLTGSVLFYINHGLCKAVLFMMSGILIHAFHTRSISRFGGLGPRMPITTIASLIAFLGLAGTPPIVGFWGELFIFAGSMHTALAYLASVDVARALVTAIAIVGSALTAGYGLWTIRRVFFGQPSEETSKAKEGPAVMVAPVIILAALAVILGVYPTIITEPSSMLARELVEKVALLTGGH